MNIDELSSRAVEIRKKYDELNKSRSGKEWTTLQLAQGFVGDVGDLQKIAMAKEGLRDMDEIDSKLAHELSDCLWSVLVLAERYGVDIEKEFLKTMDDLDERIANGG